MDANTDLPYTVVDDDAAEAFLLKAFGDDTRWLCAHGDAPDDQLEHWAKTRQGELVTVLMRSFQWPYIASVKRVEHHLAGCVAAAAATNILVSERVHRAAGVTLN